MPAHRCPPQTPAGRRGQCRQARPGKAIRGNQAKQHPEVLGSRPDGHGKLCQTLAAYDKPDVGWRRRAGMRDVHTITYAELVERQERDRRAFGRMLLNWRRGNGWTQYTVCSWAEEAGFEAISYGNLSVIEQGKAGELRQKAFWQLWEVNRRIAARDWGNVPDPRIEEKLKPAIPLGDGSCPVWGPVEFWACYCGLRAVPAAFRNTPAPTVNQRKAAELSARWRHQLRSVVEDCDLDPGEAMEALVSQAGEEQSRRFYAVLTGFGDYSPEELRGLWLEEGLYRPGQWLDQWEEMTRRGSKEASGR